MMSDGQRDQWVRRFSPAAQAGTRLVCFPHAGGSASYFLPVSRALAPRVEVLSLQYPGRQDRRHEPCLTSIATLADQATAALLPWLDRPTAFFGHSMGAVLAFEVTRRLHAHGVIPTVLFVSGRRAPSTYRLETTHRGTDAQLAQELRGLDGTEASLLQDDDLLNMILPAVRGDYTAIETYPGTPDGTVDAPVVALIGVDDPKVTGDEAAAWARHTTAGFSLHPFPGGHFYLNSEAPAVIRLISDRLAAPASR
jgi:surfactin synthase thioesterase subunit